MSLVAIPPVRPSDDPRQHLSDPDALYEVVNGQVVELPDMGFYATAIAAALYLQLAEFVAANGQGRVAMEAVFVLDPATNLRRRPDVAYISFDRWPADREIPEEGDLVAVPDLAIEVVSPHDLHKDLMAKIEEYFRYGVRQVWTVHPPQRNIWLFSSPTQVQILALDDTLAAPDLLPNFSTPIAPLFKRTVG